MFSKIFDVESISLNLYGEFKGGNINKNRDDDFGNNLNENRSNSFICIVLFYIKDIIL